MRFGSVCSGIEAASVAWSSLGWNAAWFSEIEPFPCAVLAHHYPTVPNLGDMRKIAVMIRDGYVEAPDLFCGGTPCQAFSVAGLRNSLDDARGNLALTFCEIANEIDTRRAADGLLPSIIFWENVPGVLSTKDNAFGCFLAGLAGATCTLEPEPCPVAGKSGKFWKWNKKEHRHALSWPKSGCVIGPQRTVAWRVLDAQYFGLAQRRQRVFVVASAREGFDPVAVLLEFEGVRRDSAPSRDAGEEVTGTISSRTSGGGGLGTDFDCAGGLQPVSGIDLRNSAITGQVAQTLQAGGHGVDPGGMPHVLSPSFAIQAGALRTNPNSGPDGVGVQADIAYTIEARAEVQAVCFAENSRGELRAEGGDGQRTGCLSTGGGKPGQGTPMIYAGIAVRRLTPRECERLQGFEDDYTLVPVRGKPAADGPRYKALGNSWAVPNVRWIGRRINDAIIASGGDK